LLWCGAPAERSACVETSADKSGAAEGGRSGSDKPSGSKRCGGNSLACPSRSRAPRGKMVAQFSKKALTGCFVFRKQNFNIFDYAQTLTN